MEEANIPLSKDLEDLGAGEKLRIDIYGLWYQKYMEDKRSGGVVFNS